MNTDQKKLLAFLLTDYWIDPNKTSRLDDAIDKALASFDPEYGDLTTDLNPSDVLLPIILDLHGRLEYEQRKAKQSTLDAYAAIDLYENLKKEKESIVSELQRYIERVRVCEEELEQLRNKI